MVPPATGIVSVGISLFVDSATPVLCLVWTWPAPARVVVPVTGGSGVVLTITGWVWRSVGNLQSAVPVVSSFTLVTVELHLALLS